MRYKKTNSNYFAGVIYLISVMVSLSLFGNKDLFPIIVCGFYLLIIK